MSQVIQLPYKFDPRHYQSELLKAFFVDGKKRIVSIEHRRAGKDKSCVNLVIPATQMRVGTYIYAFPTTDQARAVIWDGIDRDGLKYLDHIPKEIIAGINHQKMAITFKNGSVLRFIGTYKFDRQMGTNPIGFIFSEYQSHSPKVWDYIRPILAENGGWSLFQGTPRGHNHLYQIYHANKENPDWFVRKLTADDTYKDSEKTIHVVSAEAIEAERKAGMSEDMIQQEFYCSFEAAQPGAYYADQINKAFNEGRVRHFEPERDWATYTAWDLGNEDATSIWIIQVKENEIRLLDHYENHRQPMDHYAKYLHDFARRNNLKYYMHFGPHDAAHTEQTSNITRMAYLRRCGIHFRLVRSGPGSVEEGIEATRHLFQRFHIHSSNCEFGIECLKEYHSVYDEKRKTFSAPYHNWASHAADALRYFSLGFCDNLGQKVGVRKMKDWDPI